MCNCPVVVQFGLQFFLIAVHFNSFSVKMNSIDEISFLEGLITLIPINISKENIKQFKKKFKNRCQSLSHPLWLGRRSNACGLLEEKRGNVEGFKVIVFH